MYYFDYAAATPVDPRVLKEMLPYFSANFYNPSATYLPAKNVSKILNKKRADIAKILGARASELVFTAGGTEANNLAINGVMQQYPDANILVSEIEHESVLKPAQNYSQKLVPVLTNGIIDIKALEKSINNNTVLISIMYANNEIGTIQPINKIASVIKAIRTKRTLDGNTLPLLFHTDACQVGQYLDIHVNSLGVDMMTLNGGKIYGPKQSGMLFVKTGTKIKPQIIGGGQENGMRGGTENVAGIVGFAKALTLVQENRHAETTRLQTLQYIFINMLKENIPNSIINGGLKNRLPNNINLTIPGYDNERLLIKLEELGVICAVGSACSASNDEPSHVLRAIGVSDANARATLRFTMGKSTTESSIKKTIDALVACLRN